jgi:hypothetical protein
MHIYAISTIFTAVMIYNLALMLILGSREHSPRSFGFAAILIGTWVLSAGFAFGTFELRPDLSAFFVRTCYYVGSLIAFALFYFSLTYPENHKPASYVRILLVVGGVLFLPLYYAKDLAALFGGQYVITEQTMIKDVFLTPRGYLGWHFGNMIVFFDTIFFGFFGACLAAGWQKYRQQTDPILRKQAYVMFLVLATGMIPTGIMNAAFPGIGLFGLFWVGLMSSFGWALLLGYSVVKQGQMNVRTATAELLIVAMILLMFIGFFAV